MTIDFYKSTFERPFGFLRNIQWWIFFGSIGHEHFWLRAYPSVFGHEIDIPYGLSITKKTPLIGWLIFKDWSVKILRAKG